MKRIYWMVIAKPEAIAFFAGLVVSYVVGLTANETTEYHWIALTCGCIVGLLCIPLTRISKSFEDACKTIRKDNPAISRSKIFDSAWTTINEGDCSDNNLGLRPRVAMPVVVLLSLACVIFGTYELTQGKKELKVSQNMEKKAERDALVKELTNQYSKEVVLLRLEACKVRESISGVEIQRLQHEIEECKRKGKMPTK